MIDRLTRRLVAGAVGLAMALALAGCPGPNAGTSGPAVTADPNQALYESVIAADNASAIAFQGASNLASLCKIPTGSIAGVNAAFQGISAGLSQANADIAAGNASGAQVAYTSALASLQAVQATLATAPVTAAESSAMIAKARAEASSAPSSTTTQVISLIIEDLPVLLSSGSQLAGVINTYIGNLGGGTAVTTYAPADVATADSSQKAALAVWVATSKTVCK